MKNKNVKSIKKLAERLVRRIAILVIIGFVIGWGVASLNKISFEQNAMLWKQDMRIGSSITGMSFGQRHDWDQLPQFCKYLLQNPKPFSKTCNHNPKDWICRSQKGTSAMFSTGHQDYYLFTKHFKYLKRKGIYIDIATNDPFELQTHFSSIVA